MKPVFALFRSLSFHHWTLQNRRYRCCPCVLRVKAGSTTVVVIAFVQFWYKKVLPYGLVPSNIDMRFHITPLYVYRWLAAVLAFDCTLMLINKPVLCVSDLVISTFSKPNTVHYLVTTHIYKLPQEAHPIAPDFNLRAYFTCNYVGKDLHLTWYNRPSCVHLTCIVPLLRIPIPPPHNIVFPTVRHNSPFLHNKWRSEVWDSNPKPSGYEPDALTNWANFR